MPAVSGRKKCRQSRVGRYAGNFGPEKNAGKFGPEKNASNIGSEQNVGKFEPEKMPASLGRKKKCRCFWAGKKLPEKRQLPANLEDCLKKNGIPEKPEQVPSLLKQLDSYLLLL